MHQPADSYSIRVAARLTGIPADTLRMWERRYGFPSPKRRATGVRSYSHIDVERLLLIARALRAGFRPGEVVGKSPEELEQILSTATAGARALQGAPSPSIQGALDALQRFDPVGLSAELRRSLAILGAKRFLLEVCEPLASGVRDLWAEGRMSVRHQRLLASTLSAQIRLLLSTYESASRTPTILITTLPGEARDLGPELLSLYLAVHNAVPRLLSDMPPDQIVEAARELHADVVLVWMSEDCDVGAAVSQLRWMASALPRSVELWGNGAGAERVDLRDGRFRVVQSWAALDEQLEGMRTAARGRADGHADG
ncbi:MAG TPA: MerR family transcriptional regulator, partial [Polyangiaceae bacterium]|nr:MerR family transcriptional regulator [Polyangiaceae bacterium]